MNTRTPIQPPDLTRVLSISFNNDYSCFGIGVSIGWAIHETDSMKTLQRKQYDRGVGICQMRHDHSVIMLVGGGRNPWKSPRKLSLWDDDPEVEALYGEWTMPSSVLGVRMDHIVMNTFLVIMRRRTALMALAAGKHDVFVMHDTADNPLGLCAYHTDQLYALPARTPGQVQLITERGKTVSIIPAHSAPLVAMCLSLDGQLLATASEKGTIIRVFATKNCARVAELRRGLEPAKILSLAFSPSGRMLGCTSDKGTLHIFDIPQLNAPAPPNTAEVKAAGGVGSRSSGQTSSLAKATAASRSTARGSHVASPGVKSPDVDSATESLARLGFSSNTAAKNNVDLDSAAVTPTEGGDASKGKWGMLGKLPMMPRYFTDVVSFAQAGFSIDYNFPGEGPSFASTYAAPNPEEVDPNAPPPPKGVLGWISETEPVVVGGGTRNEARWERFRIRRDAEGKRVCELEGWKRLLAETRLIG